MKIKSCKFFISTFFISISCSFLYSQTCPTYLKRNNGNDRPQNCGSTTGIPDPSTWIKQGSFEFINVTDVLGIDKVETYNSSNSSWELFQNNTSNPLVYNQNIWFGGYSGGTNKWICFYSPNGTQSPPAANWRFTFRTTSGSTFFCSYNINSSGTLPVAWESLTAEKHNSQSLIKWSTASEQKTKDFEIQFSANTIDWSPIGTVLAAGNSATQRNYSFIHTSPLKNNNYNYYRILQRDLDGKFSYSKIVSILFNEPGPEVVVYPNPVDDILTIYTSTEQLVSLYNAAGRLVWKAKLPAGRNQLPVNKFSKGVYILATDQLKTRVIIQ
jgi:hypothetical protein